MSELEELEVSIQTSLTTIRTHWAALLAVAMPGASSLGQRGSANSTRGVPEHDPDMDPLGVMVADDHVDSDADIDRATRVVSLRRLTVDVLNGWSRVVMEDRPITKALPDGTDALSMAVFLDRHAQWMSGHDAARDCMDELADLARRITQLAAPKKREWMNLGACPLRLEDAICGGQVRAWPRAEDRDGEVMARCQTCGTEAVATWWESQMFNDAELKVWLTDADLVTFVHRTFGRVVKEATIRQWVHRAILVPSDRRDDHGRRLFHREAVVYALDRHEKRRDLA